ncbi:hypothetical protein EC957_003228 [Mortierella hygrophila]|uniref:Uncharacterized protein n=1 Tax=Mortierella hygrophila TaxID=979708 RepID=A0A9P6F3I8_9FUNG|nr:hypothetical protein EC957_003228 [Mortierella hygrophila]
MDHSTPVYYEDHHQFEAVPIGDDDEEYQEDRFLRQHYGRPNASGEGLSLVHDDDDISESDDDDYNPLSQRRRHHQNGNNSHLYDDDDDDDDDVDEEEDEDEYSELDMDHHSIQLLSGSLSVRSPFLDAIREEEDEEPAVFTKPSSYPSFGSGRYLNRLSGDGSAGAWGGRGSLGTSTLEKQHQLHLQQQLEQQQLLEKRKLQEEQQQSALLSDQQGTNFNNTNQSDNGKPRGPRPPLMLGRPRSNTSSLTKVVTGFDITSSSSASTADQQQLSKDEETLRNSQASPESTMQDLEVKRVLEGAAALATGTTLSNSVDASKSAESTPLPSSSKSNQNTISLPGAGAGADSMASFGTDTQKSMDNFFGMVKSDLDKRIQEAIQEVEQKFLDRVKRLEEHTATLAGAPPELLLANASSGEAAPNAGSLMESLTRPLPAHQNPGGSLALRKEILSHVTEKVGDLDLRVNQMEVLVSYKLVDIESKVKDLHGAHNSIAQKVHQVAKSHKSNMQGVRAGDSVGENTINAEEARISAAMQPYRDIEPQGPSQGASAYLEPFEGGSDGNVGDGIVSLRRAGSARDVGASNELVDTSSSIVELRHELQVLGMRYQELNDGLLTDLMGQMRDAKLVLFQSVDEVDGRISKRVDRIEAEMHSKLLGEIEGRVQERVRAMEQTSARLEKCFDKMEGRLGALETVLASRRPRPESMYQLLQQQLQQQQQQDEENGIPPHAGTFSGFPSSPPHRSVTSMVFSDADIKPAETYTRPRRRTLAENGIYTDTQQSRQSQDDNAPLMMLDTSSNYSTVKDNSSSGLSSSYPNNNTTNMGRVSTALEGFVSSHQSRPSWSPTRGISTTATSQVARSETPLVASPLERGTVIGSRMGTIHPEYIPKTTYVPTTPIRERFSDGPLSSTPTRKGFDNSDQEPSDHGSRGRRVSLSSFDSNSLSALKPIKATATTATATATSAGSTATSIVTTTTTTTTMTTQQNTTNNTGGPAGRGGNLSVKSLSSSSLSAKLNSAAGSGANSPTTPTHTGGTTVTKTMQRAMTFDTLQSQAASGAGSITTVKTVKTPVQGPSSYRDLLHFWKAGGSGNSGSGSAAV